MGERLKGVEVGGGDLTRAIGSCTQGPVVVVVGGGGCRSAVWVLPEGLVESVLGFLGSESKVGRFRAPALGLADVAFAVVVPELAERFAEDPVGLELGLEPAALFVESVRAVAGGFFVGAGLAGVADVSRTGGQVGFLEGVAWLGSDALGFWFGFACDVCQLLVALLGRCARSMSAVQTTV